MDTTSLNQAISGIYPIIMVAIIIFLGIRLLTSKKKPEESEPEEDYMKCEKCGSDDMDELGEDDNGKEAYKCENCGHIQYEEPETDDTKSSETIDKPTSGKVEQPSSLSEKNQKTAIEPKKKGWF